MTRDLDLLIFGSVNWKVALTGTSLAALITWNVVTWPQAEFLVGKIVHTHESYSFYQPVVRPLAVATTAAVLRINVGENIGIHEFFGPA